MSKIGDIFIRSIKLSAILGGVNGGYFGSLEYPQYIKTANKDNTPFYKASYIASYVFVGSIMGSILVAISPVSIPYIVYMYKKEKL